MSARELDTQKGRFLSLFQFASVERVYLLRFILGLVWDFFVDYSLPSSCQTIKQNFRKPTWFLQQITVEILDE